MPLLKKKNLPFSILPVLIITVFCVSPLASRTHESPETGKQNRVEAAWCASGPGFKPGDFLLPAGLCDQGLLAHVYKPKRLIVKAACQEVTGTIIDATEKEQKHESDGVRHLADGSARGWLKVDTAYAGLLNDANWVDERGALVFEVACKYPVKDHGAKAACNGYQSLIRIPPVDSRVRIVGQFVQEKDHSKGMAITPVTSITVIE